MGDCKKCPFCKTEPVPEDLAGKVNLTEWSSCDVDAVGLAAADRIANQSTHIAALQQKIEKLRGQNEQLREAAALVTKESAELLERRWIPVEERLPEDRSDVLVVAYWHENGASIWAGALLHTKMVCSYRNWRSKRCLRHPLDAAAGTAEGGNVNEKTNN